MKNILNNKITLIALTLLVGLSIGWLIKPSSQNPNSSDSHNHIESIAGIPMTYTCSMHPQIRQNEPGDCPICGMDLIPLELDNSDSDLDPNSIRMSPAAMQLASVQTMIVDGGNASKSLRLNGKIQKDERLNYTQSSHIPGRIEDLAVSFTGEFVEKGQVLGHIYSPELSTAQEELFQTQKMRDTQPALFYASKEKLRNWKLSEDQIEKILEGGEILDQLPIIANVSGYVTEKMVSLGDYVQRGEPIYQITDLSKVWVEFDLYESEMAWVRKGSKVNYTIQSIPGEKFSGTISFVDPVIDPTSRVAKARLEVSNPNLRLKPEMFVSGQIESKFNQTNETLTVPKSAVMWTGKRSIVYVKNSTAQGVNFQLREVVLGTALGDSYVIESGLDSREEIAVNGTFSIDAAAQLAGKPSMMNPEGGTLMTGHNHGDTEMMQSSSISSSPTSISTEAKNALKPVYPSYFDLKDALTKDDLKTSKEQASLLLTSFSQIKMSLFQGKSHDQWMDYSGEIKRNLEQIATQKEIKEVRNSFQKISDQMIAMTESFDPLDQTIYVQHCPMADSNKGADWLSLAPNIVNPYFGSSMLTCGEVTKTIK